MACFDVMTDARAAPVEVSDPPTNSTLLRFWMANHSKRHRHRALFLGKTLTSQAQTLQTPFPGALRVWPHNNNTLPVPSRRCPNACGGRGSCVISRATSGIPSLPHCACHTGYLGASCEETYGITCLHNCSRHGRCIEHMCLCNVGWSGLDCSLGQAAAEAGSNVPPTILAPRRSRFDAPTFVYPLPSELRGGGMHHFFYNGDWQARGIFATEIAFLERLHRRGHLVHDPEEAALFVVPTLLVQLGGNLWEPQAHLQHVVDALRWRYPYWNRTLGADHVFFMAQDVGGCLIHPIIRNSIIVSHFGFVEALPFWTAHARWYNAIHNIDNQPLKPPRRLAYLKLKCNGSLTSQLASGCRDPQVTHTSRGWRHGEDKWQGPCFNLTKDVVTPTDFTVSAAELERSRKEASWYQRTEVYGSDSFSSGTNTESSLAREKKYLLFMSGSVKTSALFYSQGVRKTFYVTHARTPGVKFVVGKWKISQMRDSIFCLCPSGWGYGWRIYLAVAMSCVPVLVQPQVEQAYHDLLPYYRFALSYSLADIKLLPQLLRNVSNQRLYALRAAGAKYYRALMWQEPDGLAYETLLLSLCRRALAVRRHTRPQESLPAWRECEMTTVEALLDESSSYSAATHLS